MKLKTNSYDYSFARAVRITNNHLKARTGQGVKTWKA